MIRISLLLLQIILNTYFITSQSFMQIGDINKIDAEFKSEWEKINISYLGVKGHTPLRDSIGLFSAAKFGANLDNWFSFKPTKQIVSGIIKSSLFHPSTPIEIAAFENDWNFVIEPDINSKQLCEDAKNYIYTHSLKPFDNSLNQWHIINDNICIEAEITPITEYIKDNEHFRLTELEQQEVDNAMFEQPMSYKNVIGNKICVFGPAVIEKLHNYRPEIHPSELIWFKNNVDNDTVTTIMVINDASRRFSGSEDFNGYDKMNNIEPWGKPPVFAEFKYAIKVNPVTESPIYEIKINSDHQYSVYKEGQELDKDLREDWREYLSTFLKDGSKEIVINNKKVATISETMYGEKLGLKFDDLRIDEHGNIIGYIVIRIIVGESEKDCGYAEINIKKNNNNAYK